MKKILLFISIFTLSFGAFAQLGNVGIGTSKPSESAILELSSTKSGLLIPRLTASQINSIIKPSTGLLVYQLDNKAGFYYYDGNKWTGIMEGSNSIAVANPDNWSITGNAGTTPGTNYIGTSDNKNLVFKVWNAKAGLIDFSTYNTTFGFLAGNSNVASYNTFVGYTAGYSNTSGGGNLGIGASALYSNTTGINNTAIGANALYYNTIGTYNTAIGIGSLQANTTGGANVGIGPNSLNANTTGVWNVAIGSGSLEKNTTGQFNMAIGGSSLFSNLSGSNNLALGANAGRSTLGSGNIFIGPNSGYNETGSDKLYISNSNTTMPLVYGDFSAKYVTIGDVTPALRTQGTATGGYNLLVKGGILTEKVKVALAAAGTDWADYVFESDYQDKMMTLEQVEEFTKINKHLPNVPSAQEMVNNGLDVSQTSKMFMEKIEELTIYLIELNKKVKSLELENQTLKNRKN